MRRFMIFAAAITALAPCITLAQHSSYNGQERRDIKALSGQEVEQYLSGGGMGFARAAELNRYPGPMHVLELGDRLALSDEQRIATKRLMDAHKAEAREIGAKLVEAERILDQLFAGGKVGAQELAERVQHVTALAGQYRLSHLETHRQMRALLTAEQVERYDRLRGYGGAEHSPSEGHHGHR